MIQLSYQRKEGIKMKTVKVTAVDTFKVSNKVELVDTPEGTI
jgi:hypothetical protein